ncbi:xanthine dehydrogenase family protein molybdopterin-binding subunit, partial [Leisingera sp.]|uniref:xanthine dehydrogenase family protein molybdopterin-binding subunit n=1 Tax=Leisingera sp. TaxID=1879318 RepID=UPI002B271E74
MGKFGKSQPVKRVEDLRFLTGQGQYIEDAAPAGALRAWVLRSPVAHGVITALNVEDARACDGVHAVITLADLEAAGIDVSMDGTTVKNRDGSSGAAPERPMLARDRVRYVGEPVAVVIAETLDQARDAGELIELGIDDLPAKMDVLPGGEPLHAEVPDNRAFDWGMGDEAATAEAFRTAAHTVALQVEDNRIIVNSMEPRGCFAEWTGGRLHFTFGGQGVWAIKSQLAAKMRLDEAD